jgi:signal transduction histidine kinase
MPLKLSSTNHRQLFSALRGKPDSSSSDASAFEGFLIDLPGAFARVSLDEIDQEIERWLERIGIAFDLDRSTIAAINATNRFTEFSHGWVREATRIPGNALDANLPLPWTTGKMLTGETVVMDSRDSLPRTAVIDRESFFRCGIRSNVTVPIKVSGVPVAAMSFSVLARERSWPVTVVRRFQAMAEIFGYAFERKNAHHEINQLRNALVHLSRVTTLGELSATLTHELGQPLSAVQINAEVAQASLKLDQPDLLKVKEAIADIVRDNTRATDIIRRLRPLFRRDRGMRSKFDLAEALEEVGNLLRDDARTRKISFVLNVQRPLPPVLGERIQLQQAIINLVLNAFDAVAEQKSDSRSVFLDAAEEQGNSVKILIRDLGKGIEPRLIERIFEPFFTTKTTGMGMGLSISRSIIQAHGGRLSISSAPSKGTTVQIDLSVLC